MDRVAKGPWTRELVVSRRGIGFLQAGRVEENVLALDLDTRAN